MPFHKYLNATKSADYLGISRKSFYRHFHVLLARDERTRRIRTRIFYDTDSLDELREPVDFKALEDRRRQMKLIRSKKVKQISFLE